jgi:hypothetical protein
VILKGSYEPITASRHRRNDPGTEHLAQRRHLHVQIGLLDGEARPDQMQQFAFADDSLPAFEQDGEHVERPRTDFRLLLVDQQDAAFQFEAKPAETTLATDLRSPAIQRTPRKPAQEPVYIMPNRNF